jgi:hypothetical protein
MEIVPFDDQTFQSILGEPIRNRDHGDGLTAEDMSNSSSSERDSDLGSS